MEEDMEVNIVKLEPMRVASFIATGTSPEEEVWKTLRAWAEPLGLYQDPGNRLFGFNNPNPTPGNPVYGYEAWIQLPNHFEVDEPNKPEDESFTIKEFPGGNYAVTRVEVPKGKFEVITEGWQALVDWHKANRHEWPEEGACFCLEESVRTDREDLEFILDLYLPIS